MIITVDARKRHGIAPFILGGVRGTWGSVKDAKQGRLRPHRLQASCNLHQEPRAAQGLLPSLTLKMETFPTRKPPGNLAGGTCIHDTRNLSDGPLLDYRGQSKIFQQDRCSTMDEVYFDDK